MDGRQTMLGGWGHRTHATGVPGAGRFALRILLVGALSIVLCSFGLMSGCSRNAATGEEHLNFYSQDQEIQMGRQADSQVVATMGLYPDQHVQQWLQSFGEKLARVSERPNLPWTFRMVDDPVVNAFAIPGGFIYVTRGLMTHVSNEAELAGVMGHEIGHVAAQHTVHTMSSQELTQLGITAGMAVDPRLQRYAGLVGAGLQLLYLKYSRTDESQADHLGLRYMTRAGYDPAEMIRVFQMLDRVTKSEGGSQLPQWLETHPDPPNRIAAINKELDTMGVAANRGTVGGQEYLALVDGMVYGENPREGFFRNGIFYQPDMKFQYRFPSGWQTQNQKQSVAAVSKNQDAIMQITTAPGSSPQAAANTFFSQQGIQAQPAQQGSMNGLQTVSGQFTATTQQGPVQGMATFVGYDGNVFQIIGYTTQQGWPQYSGVFSQSMQTFSPLTDPTILAVQPMRIKIVRTSGGTSLAQVAKEYNSPLPVDQLAIINQVPNNATVPGNQEIKVVVGNAADASVLSR